MGKIAAGIIGLMLAGIAHTAEAASQTIVGNSVKKVYAAVSADQTLGTADYTSLPGAARTISVPAGGDTIIATFTSECVLFGSSGAGNWVEVQIRDNGTATAAAATTFCSDKFFGSHALRVAKHLPAGTHNIQVVWRVVKGVAADSLTGYLDDWALTVLQAE